MTIKTLRLGSLFAAILVSLAFTFSGARTSRLAASLPTTLPAPHLGYGLNVWDRPQLAAGLGFDWVKFFEEAGPPPTTALPYKVLYRIFVDGYPASLGTYLQHMHDLAQAGLGKVQAYEIGNEPNLEGAGFWGNQNVNPEAYADLVCAVYPVIKSVDPQARIVSAGLAPVGPWGPEYWNTVMDETVFAQRMLARMKAINNGQFCIDAFGYHPHGFAFAPETDYHDAPNGFAFRSAERMHDIMVAAGATPMQMWATEFGWIRHPASDPWTDENGNVSSYGWCTNQQEMSGFLWMLVTEQQQADYLVRAFQYADANWPWMGPMFVWNLDFFYRGTLCTPQRFYSLFHATDGDPNNVSPTLAFGALADMPKRLTTAPAIYLPLLIKNDAPSAGVGPVAPQLGLAFVSSAEAPANETRYQRALAINGALNRWPMYWSQIEKNPVSQPRVFDWSRQDANIIADVNHGLTVLPILMQTPPGFFGVTTLLEKDLPKVGQGWKLRAQQRSFSPTRTCPPAQTGPAANPPPGLTESIFDDGSDLPGSTKSINPANRWAIFVYAAVNRYKPGGVLAQQQGWSTDQGVRYWEIWNEEDLCFFFNGSPTDFARLQKVAYLAAKQADPTATIVFGGLAHFETPSWLDEVLNVIATDPMSTTYHGFMDAVASHNYSWAWQTFGYLLQDRQRLDARGFTTVKLWLTETGVPVCDDPAPLANPPLGPFCPSTYRGTMSEQADFVIQTVAWANWLQAERIVWFQLYDDAGNDCKYDAFGLVRNPPSGPCTARDGTPRPAYTTFKVAGQYLTGVQPYWRDRRTGTTTNWTTGNQEILAFKRPATGQRVVTMWTRYYTADTVILTATSSSALLIQPGGAIQTVVPVNGVYTINLPAASNLGAATTSGKQPDGTSPIGGSPRILVESDPAAQ